MRLGIYGAGSLGIIIGAYLTRAGVPVDLINRNPVQVDALNQNGARVVGGVTMTVPVRALLPDAMVGPYDAIFLTTKQHDNRAVAKSLAPYLGKDGVLVTMQNGLPEWGLSEVLGQDRVLGCTVEWGATLVEPGVSELTSSADSLTFGLGAMSDHGAERLPEIRRVLEAMCPVKVEDNFVGVRWSKLLINAAFSGVSTVLGCTFGGAVQDKRARKVVQAVIKECIDVARAEGVKFAPVQGKNIVLLLDYNNPMKKAVAFQIIPAAIKKHAALKASMLQDIEKGKLTEVDAINGIISSRGRKVGVPTPACDRVVRVIHLIERGECKPSFENLKYFE